MMADLTIKISWRQGCLGHREAEDAVLLLAQVLKPTLDERFGETGWKLDWEVDYSRSIAEHNELVGGPGPWGPR